VLLRLPAAYIACFASAALTAFATGAYAAPASAPHAAACVAALKAREASMAASAPAGTPAAPELLSVVQGGIAIIGTQYLAGLRESEARQMLDAAEHEFEALPQPEAQARQAACQQEGSALYRHASSFERMLITRAAERRIRRLRGG